MITAKEAYDKTKERQSKLKDTAKAFAMNEVEEYLEKATLKALDAGESSSTYWWSYEVFKDAGVDFDQFLIEVALILTDLGYKVKTEIWSDKVLVTWDWSEFIDE